MSIDSQAKQLWDFLSVTHQLKQPDVILGFGSFDTRTADTCVELYDRFKKPIVFSGNVGRSEYLKWDKAEALIYADIARDNHVPSRDIFTETQSRNTGQNAMFTSTLLRGKDIEYETLLLVHVPFFLRRALAVSQHQWPNKRIICTTFPVTYETYPNRNCDKDRMIHFLVGEIDRLQDYPKKGFFAPQRIPQEVEEAAEKLKAVGFTTYALF